MSYDAIVVGAGISGAATAYHLRKAGAKTLLIERGEPASGGTGKSAAIIRQSYSTPLLVRLARASITMFENAQGRARPGRGLRAGRATASSCRRTCWRARRRTSRCRSGLGIVNEWSEGPGFPQHLPEINPDGVAGIVYEPHGGYADPVQATEAYVDAFKKRGGEFRARTPVRRLLREGDRITGVELDSGEVAREHRGERRRPVGEAARRRAPGSICRCARCASRTPCGRCRRAARCRRPRSRWASMPTYYRPLGKQSLHHRARLSRRSMSTSIPTTTKPAPTTISSRDVQDARRAPLPGVRRHEADRGLCGAL